MLVECFLLLSESRPRREAVRYRTMSARGGSSHFVQLNLSSAEETVQGRHGKRSLEVSASGEDGASDDAGEPGGFPLPELAVSGVALETKAVWRLRRPSKAREQDFLT